MKTEIKFIQANTGTLSNCADHFKIDTSSRKLNWAGILLEKGSCDHFYPRKVMTSDFYFAMLVDTDLKWNIEVEGKGIDIYSPSETIWINPPNTPFSNTANSEIDFVNLLISEDILYKYYEGYLPKVSLKFLRDYNIQDSFMSHMIFMFYEEVLNEGRNGLKFLEHLLTIFATYFIDNYSDIREIKCNRDIDEVDFITNEKLSKIDDFIECNMDKNITIEDLANVLKMTKFQFLRVFKKEKGITPYQYLITYKINIAKKDLRSTEKSFTEIAISLGFSDSSHFARTFKKYTGYTPTQYRTSV